MTRHNIENSGMYACASSEYIEISGGKHSIDICMNYSRLLCGPKDGELL